MKRDLDLARQLLTDIEARGADCAINALKPGVVSGMDEQIRHHVRLLIDAGYVKEVQRVAGGSPCVRLTNAGHEFLEVARSEGRWRDAKWLVQQRTGGLSLEALRTVLTNWAVDSAACDPVRRPRAAYRPYRLVTDVPMRRQLPLRHDVPFRHEVKVEPRDINEELQQAPPSSAYLERFDWPATPAWPAASGYREAIDTQRVNDGYYRDRYAYSWDELDEQGVSLPGHVV